MERRRFLKASAATGVALSGLTGVMHASASVSKMPASTKFKLKYAPHFGMFKNSAGEDLIDQIKYMADQGFTAFEDNGMMKRDVSMQNKIGETLAKLNMTMGVFVAYKDFKNPTLARGKEEDRKEFLKQIEASVSVAKRVNAKWMTVVPGTVDLKLVEDYQTANVIESLKQASAILEPHGIVMVLEPKMHLYNPLDKESC